MPFTTIQDVLAATAAGELDLGLLRHRERHRGHGHRHDRHAHPGRGPADPARGRARHPHGAHGGARAPTWPTSTRCCRSPTRWASAAATCARTWRHATIESAPSTAEAARLVGEKRPPGVAAIGPSVAADLYDLEVVAIDIEDHPGNQTRFVAVARDGVPARSGHDKTSVVIYQKADVPGSLLTILQEFAARNINLSKLESRPTKRGLGDYCFVIDLDGHIDDELVADALRNLKSKQADVKFLGSYPAAGANSHEVRAEASESWRAASDWLEGLRAQIR